jgi:hypothetical protein
VKRQTPKRLRAFRVRPNQNQIKANNNSSPKPGKDPDPSSLHRTHHAIGVRGQVYPFILLKYKFIPPGIPQFRENSKEMTSAMATSRHHAYMT